MLWSSAVGAGFEPTTKSKVRAMLELAKVGPGDVVYDLGSGDGRIVIMSAKEFGAKAVGVEADPTRVFWSRMMTRLYRVGSLVTIEWGNFFNKSVSDATVVTLFLTTGTNRKLAKKLREELRPGTRVVSYVWEVDSWTPQAEDKKRELFLYVV